MRKGRTMRIRPCLRCGAMQSDGYKFCKPCAKLEQKERSAFYQATISIEAHRRAARKHFQLHVWPKRKAAMATMKECKERLKIGL